MKKVFVRLRGGIGNQLFQYAFARRLALFNDAELIIDNISGFEKDFKYRRIYELQIFNLPFKTIKAGTYFFYNYKRKVIKFLNRFIILKNNIYLEENFLSFDKKIKNIIFNKNIYVDGYFQCFEYFLDIENTIKSDLRLDFTDSFENKKLLEDILNFESVAVHFRFFSDQDNTENSDNIAFQFYEKAILYSFANIKNPHFFIFSDNISQIKKNNLFSDLKNITFVNSDLKLGDMCDFWLMTLCKHNIIANSTFSWWAAWMNNNKSKVIICPDFNLFGTTSSWGFEGLIPDKWIKIY